VKLTRSYPDDGRTHAYCLACGAEGPESLQRQGRTYYACQACGAVRSRLLVIDPAAKWWTDGSGEYWHESAGVFVREPAGAFLFFRRTKHPFGLTVPAGHVGFGEAPAVAARRELAEEVGLAADSLIRIGTDDIVGDECRRGADVHRWHSFGVRWDRRVDVTVVDEGVEPVWLTLAEALAAPLTLATRYVMAHHRSRLEHL
jgi:ADP-ribose pyrophosphatase YjhB (NUDIX family)/DNA-directed RNA polymerase subunit RPC12/RpoP